MKKVILFALLLFGALLNSTARDFTYTYEGQTLTYTVISESEKTCMTKEGINGAYPGNSMSGYSGYLVIPEIADGYTVTKIGAYGFSYLGKLISVELPHSVTTLGNSCFSNCSSLTSIEIPNSVTTLGNSCFSNCSSLTSIEIPNSVTSIGDYCFYGCSGLNSVTIPNSVTSLSNSCFSACSGLTSIEIPNSVTSLGEECFRACSSLNSVTIPNSVTSLGKYCFYACSSLTSIEIPNSVTSLSNSCFSACSGLTSIEIPNSVTTLGNSCFSNCSSLTSIEIPNSVTSIGDYCFYDCSSLTSVTIPNSVTSIGTGAFIYCSALKKANFESIESLCNIKFATSTSNPIYYAHNLFIAGEEVKDLVIPNSVTSISDYCFSECSGLNSVTIPNSVFSIGNRAFTSCSRLNSIIIPNSVTSIGSSCFSNCTNLSSLIIPSSVERIGSHAFASCSLNPLIILGKISTVITEYKFPLGEINYRSQVFCRPDVRSLLNNECSIRSLPIIVSTESNPCGSKINLSLGSAVSSSEYYPFFKELNNANYTFLLNSNEYPIKPGESIEINGLQPESDYLYDLIWENAGLMNGSLSGKITTDSPDIKLGYSSITQTVIKDFYPQWEVIPDAGPTNIKYIIDNQEYDYNGKTRNIGNLTPDTSYPIIIMADYNGKTLRLTKKITTKSVIGSSNVDLGPTSAKLNVKIEPGNATIKDMYWSLDGKKLEGKNPILTGLNPSTTYTFDLNIQYSNGGSNTYSFKKATSALDLKILQPKCTTSTTAILGATTNISNEEPNVGFQWKKYDAPASLQPSEGFAVVYDGMMEGYVKNLQPTSYYNVRAFYKSASDQYYYTDWITFDPSDFSYFEPTVRTYAVTEVNGRSVTLRGFALPGSDDIISQGFEYNINSGTHYNTRSVTSGIVTATGQMMYATLSDLPNGEYTFRAFVQTSAGYTYGEPQTFVIDTVGIDDVMADEDEVEIIGYYDLSGRRYDVPQRGFNIVVYSDGHTRKFIQR